ncbi:hypothetical protein K435DRAFT_870024 [Dendrothele bispora CBS 962.96]|uniref:Uncharacterized protein n=1 Tax=Dendrothele bispora (strain CBS 962.96) TaxID=1314807 RepID=A0A4V4HCT7_DENBC|nr:hypothetical protein K435DRAFT_870024 [Dendrothele bispora CBS 962.96]
MSMIAYINMVVSGVIELNLSTTFCSLLYGVYLVLFAICMYIIAHKKGSVSRLHFAALVALFVLATLGFILDCIYTNFKIEMILIEVTNSSLEGSNTAVPPSLSVTLFVLHGLTNIIADIILIHRCYKVWGAKKKVIVLPVIISIINNGLAFGEIIAGTVLTVNKTTAQDINSLPTLGGNYLTFENDAIILYLAVTLFTNLVITFMIAGRIWWIGHQISKFLPSRKFNLARQTMAICLESGIMYPLVIFPTLVLSSQAVKSNTPSQFFEAGILIQAMGIAPTFIIVRVALGISIESVQDTICNENGQRDRVVLSTWQANHNIDEPVQRPEERSVV